MIYDGIIQEISFITEARKGFVIERPIFEKKLGILTKQVRENTAKSYQGITDKQILSIYNNFYLLPYEIDAGFISDSMAYSLYFWNAFFENKTILLTSVSGQEGLEYEDIVNYIFYSNHYKESELVVLKEGPSKQDSSITYSFNNFDVLLTIDGIRVIVFKYNINFIDYRENLEFTRAIFRSDKLKEQRRETSRKIIFDITIDQDRNYIAKELNKYYNNFVLLPIFTEICKIILFGSNYIEVVEDISNYFFLNNLVDSVILFDWSRDFLLNLEVVNFTSVVGNRIYHNQDNLSGSYLYPAIISSIRNTRSNLFTSNLKRNIYSFEASI